MVMRTIFGLIITLALVSCGGKTARHPIDGDSIAFKYATLPSIVEYDEFTVVTLENPWKDGKALHTYSTPMCSCLAMHSFPSICLAER